MQQRLLMAFYSICELSGDHTEHLYPDTQAETPVEPV